MTRAAAVVGSLLLVVVGRVERQDRRRRSTGRLAPNVLLIRLTTSATATSARTASLVSRRRRSIGSHEKARGSRSTTPAAPCAPHRVRRS
jgi:hypothetical protein